MADKPVSCLDHDNMVVVDTGVGSRIFTFIREEAEIVANGVHVNNRGIEGEISIWHQSTELIHAARLNFQNIREIQQFLREFQHGPGIDTITGYHQWDEMLYFVIAECLKKYRVGFPAVEIRNIPITDTSYQLYNLIQAGQLTNIYGKPGSGKSILALFLAILIHDGLCFEDILIPTPGNCLYLDYEADEQTVKERIDALRSGLGIALDDNKPDILYRQTSTPIVEDIGTIIELTADHDIDCVIVDGYGYAIGGDSQKEDRVIQSINALRSLRRTVILVDHDAKTGDTETPYGSTYKVAGARDLYYVRSNPGDNTLQVGIVHKKRNRGQKLQPFALEFEFIGDTERPDKIEVRKTSIDNIPDMGSSVPRWLRIKRLLVDEAPLTIKEIAEQLEDNVGSIRAELNSHKDIFIKLEGKKWGVRV